MTELLDWNAVWKETYRKQEIYTKDHAASIGIITALLGNEGNIRLYADLEISLRVDGAKAEFKVSLTPEEMEQLADHMTFAADHQRELARKLAAHNAAAEVIAEGEARQAEPHEIRP